MVGFCKGYLSNLSRSGCQVRYRHRLMQFRMWLMVLKLVWGLSTFGVFSTHYTQIPLCITIRGDDAEEYFIIMRPGQIPIIFTMSGQPCTVNTTGSAATYLSGVALPREDVQLMTIGDFTFVLNRRKAVNTRPDMSPALDNKALIYVAYANYSFKYSISIDGVVAAEYTTKSSENVGNEADVRTENVAQMLLDSFNAKKSPTPPGIPQFTDYTMTLDGNVLILERSNSTPYTVTTIDGADGKDLVAIRHKVTNLDTLPNRAPEGYKVQVWATGSKPESRYWLTAEAQDGGKVTWKESIAPGIKLGWDKATMPHVLIRESLNPDGTAVFSYKPGDWADRDVGDDLTNDFPSMYNADNPHHLIDANGSEPPDVHQ